MKPLIQKFYEAFNALNANEMVSCYHPEVTFEDPAFGVLKGENAKQMWYMLCESQKGKDFQVSYSNIKVDGTTGSANWEAFYVFSKTQRKVHNKISANFKFKDGLIIEHKDDFSLHNWAKQALGFKGWLLGGTKFFKRKLQQQTHKTLQNYIQNKKRLQ
ncbi:nuclear transport factor 2 family protein [uncultured Winogradskyella sp.]|uniref:nuclear transport factor 2 family protein n=1 Tax=uncultured Winogradskyella sp. TaxID=395353 RepID=UPI0035140622